MMEQLWRHTNSSCSGSVHVKGVGAQDSRSPTPEFVGRLGTGAGILPWTPYGEGGEIRGSKGRLGDNLFLD